MHKLYEWKVATIFQSSHVRVGTRWIRTRRYSMDIHWFRNGSSTVHRSYRKGAMDEIRLIEKLFFNLSVDKILFHYIWVFAKKKNVFFHHIFFPLSKFSINIKLERTNHFINLYSIAVSRQSICSFVVNCSVSVEHLSKRSIENTAEFA